ATEESDVSPLSMLLEDLWAQWRGLSGSEDRGRFHHWLEVTAPPRTQQAAPAESPRAVANAAAFACLDALDGILLSAIVEGAEVHSAVQAEDELQSFWRCSFAAVAGAVESHQETFLRRGRAVRTTIYPEAAERRRIYRTGLPPVSAYQMLDALPS